MANLISGYRIQERWYAFIKKAEEHRKVDDERTTKCLAIVLLEDIQHLLLYDVDFFINRVFAQNSPS